MKAAGGPDSRLVAGAESSAGGSLALRAPHCRLAACAPSGCCSSLCSLDLAMSTAEAGLAAGAGRAWIQRASRARPSCGAVRVGRSRSSWRHWRGQTHRELAEPTPLRGDDHLISEYFRAELLDSFPPAIRRFLTRSSVIRPSVRDRRAMRCSDVLGRRSWARRTEPTSRCGRWTPATIRFGFTVSPRDAAGRAAAIRARARDAVASAGERLVRPHRERGAGDRPRSRRRRSPTAPEVVLLTHLPRVPR